MSLSPLQPTAGRIPPLFSLGICLGVCLLVGYLGSLMTLPTLASGWYANLQKPPFNPPDWVFGPVWSTLYVLMGLAAWLVYQKLGLPTGRIALGWFALQLFFNAIWSGLFFTLHQPGWAFLDIVLLWGTLLVTLLQFWRVVPLAGALLAPYLLWITYAAYLNSALWRLNVYNFY